MERTKIPYEVLDASAEHLTHAQIIRFISKTNPEYVGITTNISMRYAVIIQAGLIRRHFPQIKIIIGGPWATAEYQFILAKKLADAVVLGEGEYTLIDLLNVPSWKEESLRDIRGIAYNSKSGVKVTTPREPIDDLNALGHPIWDKFPIYKYDTIHQAIPYLPVMLSRGCPYDCINCTKIIHGYVIRQRSVDNIIQELHYLKQRFNCREIIVTDDAFNANLDWAKDILRAIIKHQHYLQFKIHLMNGIRADHVDEEFASLAKQAGVYKTGIGIESGSQKVIRFLRKQLDLSKLPQVIKILHAKGILINGFFMLGIPIETPNSLTYTVDFADHLDIDFAYFFKLIVIPGTKLYDYVKAKTKFTECLDSHAISFFGTQLAFETDKLKPKNVSKAYQYSLIRFYFNPRRMYRLLRILAPVEFWYLVRRLFNFSAKAMFNKLRFRT